MTTESPRRPAQRALNFLLGSPWAIRADALRTIAAVASRRTASVEAIEAELGRPLNHETRVVTVRDGVATLWVTGPCFRYANLFVEVSGCSSYELLAQGFTEALEDPAVHAILLAIDSPGGEVNGNADLAELIYRAQGTKPIVAHISGEGCSAAYWIASAADQVQASDTALIGCLGTVLTLLDTRKADEMAGLEEIEIVSSQTPRKRVDPKSAEGRADLQALVDSLAERFIATVARNRGVTEEVVLTEYGRGGVFVGAEAEVAGLVDGIATYEDVHAMLAAQDGAAAFTPRRQAAHPEEGSMSASKSGTQAAAAAAPAPSAESLTVAQLAERHPEAAAALRLEGATAERERILAIEGLAIAGADEVIAAAKRDGTATPEATALKLIQHQRANPAPTAASEAAEGKAGTAAGKAHLGQLAGDEAKANAPTAQPSKSEDGVGQAVGSLLQFSSLRRPAAAH